MVWLGNKLIFLGLLGLLVYLSVHERKTCKNCYSSWMYLLTPPGILVHVERKKKEEKKKPWRLLPWFVSGKCAERLAFPFPPVLQTLTNRFFDACKLATHADDVLRWLWLCCCLSHLQLQLLVWVVWSVVYPQQSLEAINFFSWRYGAVSVCTGWLLHRLEALVRSNVFTAQLGLDGLRLSHG